MLSLISDTIHQPDRTDASSYRMSDGSFWRAIDVTRGVLVQCGRRTLEWCDGHGQRSSWTDGQLKRMSFARQDTVSTVRYNLPGSVFSVRGRQ